MNPNYVDINQMKLILVYPEQDLSSAEMYDIENFDLVDLGNSDNSFDTINVNTKVSADKINDMNILPEIGFIICNKSLITNSFAVMREPKLITFEIMGIEITDNRRRNPFLDRGEINLPVGWHDTLERKFVISAKNIITESEFDLKDLNNKIIQRRRQIKLNKLL